MRINIEIDEDLLREAMRCSGARTKKDAVEEFALKRASGGFEVRYCGKVTSTNPDVDECFDE